VGSKLQHVRLGIALALVAAGPAAAAPGYTITELKPLHGNMSYTRDVNLAGQATGVMTDESASTFAYRGFFYSPKGGVVDIGSLGGRNTFAVALNDAGLVTGWSQTASGAAHAFVFTPGVGMRDLGPSGRRSFGNDIGASGNVIGGVLPGDHAFVWSSSAGMRNVGAGNMAAFNFQGDVFGDRRGSSIVPGMWQPPYSTFVPFGPAPTSFAGAEVSGGNLFRHAAGTFLGRGSGRDAAFYWDGHSYRNLTPAGMRAASAGSLNDADNVVVNASDTRGAGLPFLFRLPSSPPVTGASLNPTGSAFSSLLEFSSIDDVGDIGGNGRVGGEIHGFVLTPSFVTQLDTVRSILHGGIPPASPFLSYVDRILGPMTTADITSCFELRELRGSLSVSRGVPFTAPQRQVSANALQAVVSRNACPEGLPAVPVTVPHVFARKGEREQVTVRVARSVTIRADVPLGARFDVVGIREKGRTPKLKRTRTKTSVTVKVTRLKPGMLRFAVVARKLLTTKGTPVITTVA